MNVTRVALGARSWHVALWFASLALGIALIAGPPGGAAARPSSGVTNLHRSLDTAVHRHALPGIQRRLLQQRIGGSPMSPE